MRRELSSLLILALTGLVASDVTAQQEQSDFVIRSETKLVLAPFHVIKKRNYIEGLSETDFELLVDGAPYEIGLFEGPASGDVPDGAEPGAKGRSVPVEIILLLDVSFSVINRGLLDVYTLKEEVLDHLGDEVSVSVYAFAERLSRFSRPTRDIAKLEQALDAAYKYAHLETRLYESIIQTCRDATQSASNAKRMMLVFSDGFDNGDLTAQAAANAANFFGIQLYPVVLGHDQIEDRAMEQGGARSALNRIGRRAPPRAVQGNPKGWAAALAGSRERGSASEIRRARPHYRRPQLRPQPYQQRDDSPHLRLACPASPSRVLDRVLSGGGRRAPRASGENSPQGRQTRRLVRRSPAGRRLKATEPRP